MQIYPAIDLKGGRIVRWDDVVYDADPLRRAEQFVADGADWLHVVDLDRAFDTGRNNVTVMRAIAGLPGVRVQVGGLLGNADLVREALDLGAARAVISTAAVTAPRSFTALVRAFGADRLAAAIDVREGRVTLRGSKAVVDASPPELLERIVEAGIGTIVYRDLARESSLEGADVAGAQRLVGRGAGVIVSGGIGGVDDVTAARVAGLTGVILGRALYESRVTLKEALACSA